MFEALDQLDATHRAFGDRETTLAEFDSRAPRLAEVGLAPGVLADMRSAIAARPEQALGALKASLAGGSPFDPTQIRSQPSVEGFRSAEAAMPRLNGRVTTRRTIDGQDYITLRAPFDPALASDRSVLIPPGRLAQAQPYLNLVDRRPGDKDEELGYYVARGDDAVEFQLPPDKKVFNRGDAAMVRGNPPPGSVFGNHGHLYDAPERFLDAPTQNGGYGDTGSLAYNPPVPMMTTYRGKHGVYELDNGRLQFSFDPGALSDADQQRKFRQLEQEQKNFNKVR